MFFVIFSQSLLRKLYPITPHRGAPHLRAHAPLQWSKWNCFETKFINSRKYNVSVPVKDAKRSIVRIFDLRYIWRCRKTVFTVVKWIHHGGCWKKKLMSYCFNFKLRVVWKLTENGIENHQIIYCPLRMPHLRAQGDSLKGACAAKCSNFDFEKFENSIIPLKGACAPMRDNRVNRFL